MRVSTYIRRPFCTISRHSTTDADAGVVCGPFLNIVCKYLNTSCGACEVEFSEEKLVIARVEVLPKYEVKSQIYSSDSKKYFKILYSLKINYI